MHSTSFFKRRLACAPPAGNTCDQTLLRLLGCAAAWGQAPTRTSKIKKIKIYRPKRQDSQVSLESPAAFSRPPPTSSTGLWQTRSERKPWNQRRKPREAYHPQGRAYEPEQQLASSCHVAATSQCMPAVPDDSSLFVLRSLSWKTFSCPRPKHIAGHMTNPSTHQHNLASAVFVKIPCSEKQTFVNRPWEFQLFIQEG